MPIKFVRNDITLMNTEAIVNTASADGSVGSGCDWAINNAAGPRLLQYRLNNIGAVSEGEAFITPAFNLRTKYVIHAVSPFYIDGKHSEEEKLRNCYQNSLLLAKKHNIKSIAFPMISTGSFGYPKWEAMQIAVSQINEFLKENDMDVYMVVFGNTSLDLGKRISPALEEFITERYVDEKLKFEYPEHYFDDTQNSLPEPMMCLPRGAFKANRARKIRAASTEIEKAGLYEEEIKECMCEETSDSLEERMKHRSDSFSTYLLYLIKNKGMDNAEVYKRALVDKKVFSKIKNNPDYHPQKLTAMCLCVGAMLNLDETKDLLARAGYALSPCDMTDIIFSFFIEKEIYDMIELDIALEEHDLPCIIN